MTKFEAENLKVVFKTTKSVLDEFGFPNLYTVESSDVKTWFRTALSEFENAWASDEDNSVVLETNETMVRINYGATKLVIMSSEANNWVFKIPFKNCKCNYCQMEVDIYERACKENIEEFFAPCYFLEKYDSVDIYVMERADLSYNNLYSDLYRRLSDEGRSDEEVEDIMMEVEDESGYVEWLFPYYMDYDKFETFTDFLENADINDLHSGNIGYIGDRVVLIDYSGYRG